MCSRGMNRDMKEDRPVKWNGKRSGEIGKYDRICGSSRVISTVDLSTPTHLSTAPGHI